MISPDKESRNFVFTSFVCFFLVHSLAIYFKHTKNNTSYITANIQNFINVSKHYGSITGTSKETGIIWLKFKLAGLLSKQIVTIRDNFHEAWDFCASSKSCLHL